MIQEEIQTQKLHTQRQTHRAIHTQDIGNNM